VKASKGLEFPVVALASVVHMLAKGEDEQEAARVFYVAATRATQRLVIGVGGDGGLESTGREFLDSSCETNILKDVKRNEYEINQH